MAARRSEALISIDAASFYVERRRPPKAPPAAVFGPVWTVLYGLMAVAAWRAWRRAGCGGARFTLALFVLQLAVNALWSRLFLAGAWVARRGPTCSCSMG